MSPAAATVPHTAAPCESFPGTTGRICQNIIYSAGASEKVAYSSTYIVLWCTLCPQYCRIELFLRRLEIHFLPWSTAKIMCVCGAVSSSGVLFIFGKRKFWSMQYQKKRNLWFCGMLLVSPSTAGSDIGTGHPIRFPPQPRTVFLPTDAFPVPGLSWTKGPWINQVLGRCQDL